MLFDAEHFFDGAQYDRDYAMEALRAARQGGADVLVLCDTKGGTLPDALRAARRRCFARWGTRAWASIAMTIWGWPWRAAWPA